jgi:hypothetical protein
MADYTVSIGPNKLKLLRYFYPDVDTALASILNRQFRRYMSTVLRRETEYRGDLSEVRKAELIAAIQNLPTVEEREAANVPPTV